MDDLAVMNLYRKYLRILFFAMAMCALPVTTIVFATPYQLKLIADLSEFNDTSTDVIWLQPLTSPIDDGFFVAQNNGSIYFAGKDGTINHEVVLNLQSSANTPGFISLTAMTLHPSFTMPERPGYATFYTAHTTEFEQAQNHNRLTLNDPNIHFAFETVITAWKYDFEKQQIDLQTQREILRIPLQSTDNGIYQLSFSPYLKVWNADYGQLYFSLTNIPELQGHALYSGAILRIYPQLFGARNYTVSRANPFVKNPKINNEIVVLGTQNIERFFWAKNSHGMIFIQHNNSEQHWLSKAEIGDDLLQQTESDNLWQQPHTKSAMLFYQGRDFLNLRNKMVFFTLTAKQWHLSSLALDDLSHDSPTFEVIIATPEISSHAKLHVYQDQTDEIIVFDEHHSRLYSLQSTNEKANTAGASNSNLSDFESKNYVWITALVVFLLALFIFIKRKPAGHKQAINLLNKTYVRFEYDLIQQTILLFRANKSKEHQSLGIEDIISL